MEYQRENPMAVQQHHQLRDYQTGPHFTSARNISREIPTHEINTRPPGAFQGESVPTRALHEFTWGLIVNNQGRQVQSTVISVTNFVAPTLNTLHNLPLTGELGITELSRANPDHPRFYIRHVQYNGRREINYLVLADIFRSLHPVILCIVCLTVGLIITIVLVLKRNYG